MIACVLNYSDYMGDYLILILFFGNGGAGDPYILFARNLVHTGSYVILLLVLFDSSSHSVSSK